MKTEIKRILVPSLIKRSSLWRFISIYPQVLVNAKVKNEKKYDYFEDKDIQENIIKLEKEFSNNGRVLIRTSGTEPLVRVMIEGKDIDKITNMAEKIAKFIEEKLK